MYKTLTHACCGCREPSIGPHYSRNSPLCRMYLIFECAPRDSHPFLRLTQPLKGSKLPMHHHESFSFSTIDSGYASRGKRGGTSWHTVSCSLHNQLFPLMSLKAISHCGSLSRVSGATGDTLSAHRARADPLWKLTSLSPTAFFVLDIMLHILGGQDVRTMCVCVCVSVSFVCLSGYRLVCLSVRLYRRLSIYPSIHPSLSTSPETSPHSASVRRRVLRASWNHNLILKSGLNAAHVVVISPPLSY